MSNQYLHDEVKAAHSQVTEREREVKRAIGKMEAAQQAYHNAQGEHEIALSNLAKAQQALQEAQQRAEAV